MLHRQGRLGPFPPYMGAKPYRINEAAVHTSVRAALQLTLAEAGF